jgi:glycerate kinase
MESARNLQSESPMTIPAPETILLAPDSFKGSLTAAEAAEAMRRGALEALPGAKVLLHPVSDGGEGLLQVLLSPLGGQKVETEVSGPLPGRRVRAHWGWVPSKRLAIVEMAEAAGLTLLSPMERDPMKTTTRGVGELMRAALDRGAEEMLLGIGGSGTNDGGAGMAEALGVRFLDSTGHVLPPGGGALVHLAALDLTGLDERIRGRNIVVACDVANVLTGPGGASLVYGPQKGASPGDVQRLEAGLQQFADILERELGIRVKDVPGSGAAGGLGAGLLAFCQATLRPGIDVVLEATGFDAALRKADLVLCGEGRLDRQTRFGKALSGVLRRAHACGVPIAGVVGEIEGNVQEFLGSSGFLALASLVDASTPLALAMHDASHLVRERTMTLVRSLIEQQPNTPGHAPVQHG